MKEGTGAEQLHLRFCADCGERYGALTDDLDTIEAILTNTPPPVVARSRAGERSGWLPAAAVVVFVAVFALMIGHRSSPPPTTARIPNMSAFAADVSAALFADTDAEFASAESEPLAAAFQAGRTCTQEAYFNGDCNDQLSMLLWESSE